MGVWRKGDAAGLEPVTERFWGFESLHPHEGATMSLHARMIVLSASLFVVSVVLVIVGSRLESVEMSSILMGTGVTLGFLSYMSTIFHIVELDHKRIVQRRHARR